MIGSAEGDPISPIEKALSFVYSYDQYAVEYAGRGRGEARQSFVIMEQHEQIERALHEAEEKYRHIFENAMEGIYQAGRDGRFTSANPALARLHGYGSPAELMESVSNIRDDLFSDQKQHAELIAFLKKHNEIIGFEARMRRKDGSEHWVSMNIRVFRDEQGRITFFEGTMVDISERKEAEHALAESEERYRTVIEHSNDGIAMTHHGKNLYVNPRFVKMFGYDSADEIINRNITMIVHPDDRERVREIHARRTSGQMVPSRYEFKGITRAGGIIYVDISATEITYRDRPVVLVFMRDVTDRKKAEEVFLQSHRQLEQLNRAKTKAVDHISHELKTPLAVIQGNVRVLRRRLEPLVGQTAYEETLQAIERNLERLFRMQREADEILRTLSDVDAGSLPSELDRLKARLETLGEIPPEMDACWQDLKKWADARTPQTAGPSLPMDLRIFLVQAAERAKRRAAHRSVEMQIHGVPNIYVKMDPMILRAIVDGLLRNAVENTPDGGRVTMSTEERGEGDIVVRVTDTGVGISEENQQYIFDGLFHTEDTDVYTSRQPYDFGAGGKGLDLLRMKVFAERFGFSLAVESTRCRYLPTDRDLCPGRISDCTYCKTPADCEKSGGTTFTVTFRKDSSKEPVFSQAL